MPTPGPAVPPGTTVRPFRRSDRDQLTALVNTHIGAVVPGWAVPVSALLSQLEREPHEAVVDPWVIERAALVAEERDEVVAGAYLKRYRADPAVSVDYADTGEVVWCVCQPACPEAGLALLATCRAQLDAWGVAHRWASGSLPTPATYGVPDCWPHVLSLYERAGLVADADARSVEVLLAADVADLPARHTAPVDGLVLRREVGLGSTRFAVVLDDEVIGAMHVETDLTAGGSLSRLGGWGSVWELWVEEPHRRRGIATWVVAEVAAWLRLGRVDRLLDQAWPTEGDRLGFLASVGFRELTRTHKSWAWPAEPHR